MNLVPSIGLAGIYTLLAPFSSKVLPGVQYTCAAARLMSDLIAEGIDPKARYYTANQLADSKYDEDLANGVCIVSLVSSTGSWVYVPSSYIASFPNMSGVTYAAVSLLVKLGAIPDTLSLDYLKTKLANVTSDTIGILPTIQSVVTSASAIVSSDDHKLIEAARQAKITGSTTDSAMVARLQAQVETMTQQIRALEKYITDNGL